MNKFIIILLIINCLGFVMSGNLRKVYGKIPCHNDFTCRNTTDCQDGVLMCVCEKDGFCHFG